MTSSTPPSPPKLKSLYSFFRDIGLLLWLRTHGSLRYQLNGDAPSPKVLWQFTYFIVTFIVYLHYFAYLYQFIFTVSNHDNNQLLLKLILDAPNMKNKTTTTTKKNRFQSTGTTATTSTSSSAPYKEDFEAQDIRCHRCSLP